MDGLDSIQAIIAGAGGRLLPGGALAIEHGCDQAPACRALMAAGGLQAMRSILDLAGIERVTAGILRD